MFGESAIASIMIGSLTKQLVYYGTRIAGASVEDATEMSDYARIAAAQAAGAAVAIVTVDPIGYAITSVMTHGQVRDAAEVRETTKK